MEKIYVRFLKPCKGFAYEPTAEVWVNAERIAPFIRIGYAVEIEPPTAAQPMYRTAQMEPQRGRPKKQA